MHIANTHIKEATTGQIPVIQRLARECYPVAYRCIHSEEQNLFMMEKMYNTNELLHQMTEDHLCYLLLYVDEAPVGYCAYKPHPTEQHSITLDKLYILPSYKGNGLGRLLVEKVKEVAESLYPKGYKIKLDVNRSNSAVSFYNHLGFTVIRIWDAPIGNGFYMNAYEMMYTN